jgi:hypothetical protein
MKHKIEEWILLIFLILLPLSLGIQTIRLEPRVFDQSDYRDLTTKVDMTSLFSKDNNVEEYLRDQLPLRNIATSLDRNLQYIFRGKIQNQVIVGKDQQLYLGNEYGMIEENIRGTWILNKESRKSVNENVAKLNKVSETLSKNGKEFILIIAPSKESVYKEELPNWYTSKGPSVADFYRSKAKFKLIDLRSPLRSAKLDGKKVFYTNGTHWNHLGAYIGARFLHEADKELFKVPLSPISAFRKLNETPNNVQLSRNLGDDFPGFGPETRLWQMMKLSPLRRNVTETDIVYQRLTPKWSLCSIVSPADFTTCRENELLPTAVVFRDSFAEYAQQYLSEYFSKVRYVWGMGINSKMVNENDPEIVVLMIMERALLAPIGISDDLLAVQPNNG